VVGGSLCGVTEDEAEFLQMSDCNDLSFYSKHLAGELSSTLLCPKTLKSLKVVADLCRQAKDLESVEGGGEGDLLRGLVQVGRNHLHCHGQRARLVSLKRAISL